MTTPPPKATPDAAPEAGPDAVFRRHLEAGEFALQQCGDCGIRVFQPRMLCPACGSDRLDWQPVSGRGRIHSRAVLKQRPEKGGDRAIVLVDLAEGPRMMSRLPDTPAQDIVIGMAVRARILQGEEGPAVVFDPDPDGLAEPSA
ncbi:MAG: OB-fold domain-containing protein [Pararhodobacter sp.]|nr:OB-fold domain-containing protein [Pararhodobacter sp.]